MITKPQPIGTGCRFSRGAPLALPGALGYGCQQATRQERRCVHLTGWCAVKSARPGGSQTAREPWEPRGYEVAHAVQRVQRQHMSARPANRASECGGAARQSPTGCKPSSRLRRSQDRRWRSGGHSPAPQAAGAGNGGASGSALTKAGAASSEDGCPRFPRLEVPAMRVLEGVGRWYSCGTGWRPDAPRERPVVQIGISERCRVAVGQPVRVPVRLQWNSGSNRDQVAIGRNLMKVSI